MKDVPAAIEATSPKWDTAGMDIGPPKRLPRRDDLWGVCPTCYYADTCRPDAPVAIYAAAVALPRNSA